MRQTNFCLLVFLCCCIATPSKADNHAKNWCGIYHEENYQGYIRLPIMDVKSGQGSMDCDDKFFNGLPENTIYVDLAIAKDKHRSTIHNWRKFHNHFVEVRGKYRNRTIYNTRFLRDRGPQPNS